MAGVRSSGGGRRRAATGSGLAAAGRHRCARRPGQRVESPGRAGVVGRLSSASQWRMSKTSPNATPTTASVTTKAITAPTAPWGRGRVGHRAGGRRDAGTARGGAGHGRRARVEGTGTGSAFVAGSAASAGTAIPRRFATRRSQLSRLLHAELGRPARVEVGVDEQDRARQQERQRGLDRGRVEQVVDPWAEHDRHLDAHGTHHRPRHRADAGDGHGEEDGEAGLRLVGPGHDVLLGVGEEHPGQAGDPARDGERRQPGARRVDGEGRRGALVVAQGDQHPAGPVPAEGEGRHHDQRQEHEADVVEGPVPRQVDPAVQHGAAEVRGQARTAGCAAPIQ